MIQAGVLAAAMALAGGAVAQQSDGQGRRGKMMERQLSDMKEKLKLSDDQAQKVKTILSDSASKMRELRQKAEPGQPPSEEARTQMSKIREETHAKLSEVLSKEQMADYDKMMAERRRAGGKKGHRNQ